MLESIGADKNNLLPIVMDQTTMQCGKERLKPLALAALKRSAECGRIDQFRWDTRGGERGK